MDNALYAIRLTMLVIALSAVGAFFALVFPKIWYTSSSEALGYIEKNNQCWQKYGEYTSTEGIPLSCYRHLNLER